MTRERHGAGPEHGAVEAGSDGGPGQAVLLTGATGFVGGELLARYLERSYRRVFTLVRADEPGQARARLRAALAGIYSDRERFEGRTVALAGDLERPGMGLEPRTLDWLAEQVGEIVHAGASVSFSLPLQRAREINLEGTRRLLDFAERCQARGGLRRFVHISTAFIAGTYAGEFAESDLDVGQSFHNTYERTKFEAEQLVRERRDRLPIQVFRPSIVVGERPSGWTRSFNVLYAPLKAFARGALPAIPARRSAPVDVVPVDYVADSVFTLASQPLDGHGTYHLVAGRAATRW